MKRQRGPWAGLARLFLLAMAAWTLSCSMGSDKLVLGKWTNVNAQSGFKSVEFLADGRFALKLGDLDLQGDYQVLSKYRVLIKLEGIPGKFDPMETLFALHEGELIWTLPNNGGTQSYKRSN